MVQAITWQSAAATDPSEDVSDTPLVRIKDVDARTSGADTNPDRAERILRVLLLGLDREASSAAHVSSHLAALKQAISDHRVNAASLRPTVRPSPWLREVTEILSSLSLKVRLQVLGRLGELMLSPVPPSAIYQTETAGLMLEWIHGKRRGAVFFEESVSDSGWFLVSAESGEIDSGPLRTLDLTTLLTSLA